LEISSYCFAEAWSLTLEKLTRRTARWVMTQNQRSNRLSQEE
jgi:hypothetical protein